MNPRVEQKNYGHMGFNPHLKHAHALQHVKILFNKRGGLTKQMTFTVSIAVLAYNTHKLFFYMDISFRSIDFEPYRLNIRLTLVNLCGLCHGCR